MSAALVAVAAALLLVPGSQARRRLHTPRVGFGRGHGVSGRIVAVCAVAAVISVAVVEPTVGVAAGVVAVTVAHRSRRARGLRLGVREQRSLLAGLEVATAELRVGANPEAACIGAAEESKGAAAEAFRSAAATARLGGSAARGLVSGTGRRAGASEVGADLERIAAAWRTAERHGIALADLLEAARSDLLGRMRFRDRVEAGMAGARATATVLACLPLLGIGLGQMMGAGPLRVLLSGGLGGILLVVGTVLACAGLVWADWITHRVAA